jgi:hypothetical protein
MGPRCRGDAGLCKSSPARRHDGKRFLEIADASPEAILPDGQ